ncbi:hypothetical protein UC35_10485 [Ramlibacter tataouinensis]|uniref:Uncharacterized protein n=1 Tax=Ramlibacter tataouinensis TaxID=94132 RepID=A0A127JYR1_9BURK|nr:hypothetical protein UC35_10485 [Ramlibacter tataouinensis]
MATYARGVDRNSISTSFACAAMLLSMRSASADPDVYPMERMDSSSAGASGGWRSSFMLGL